MQRPPAPAARGRPSERRWRDGDRCPCSRACPHRAAARHRLSDRGDPPLDVHDPFSRHDLTDLTDLTDLIPSVRGARRDRRRFDDDEPRAARGRRPAPAFEGLDPAGPAERAEDLQYSTWLGAVHGPTPRPGWVVTDLGAVDTELGILKTGKEADVHLVE